MKPISTLVLTLLLTTGMLILPDRVHAQEALKVSQPEIRLWPNGAPGSEGKTSAETWNPSPDGFHRVTNVHNPSITVFLPPKDKANGTAVVISPGGGHRYHVMDLEGSLVAERLNAMGIAAFVLKSRLARAPESTYSVEGHSLADAQRALRLIRSRAAEWNIKTDRVGIMGFSAGGELAALAATRFESVEPKPSDPIDSLSSRPDFAVLGYGGLRGDRLTLPKNTPPTFLVVAGDDAPAAMLAEYYVKLKAQKIPAELHIYSKGGHGFGMTGRTPAFRELPLSHWPEQLQAWLQQIGMAGL
ncbi:MAG: alpha/beta hydrolase [Vicinamibacterales bacterium]